MDLKEMSVSVEAAATTAALLKPTTVIASTISKEYLKILELKEYCKITEHSVKEYEAEIQALVSLTNENSKTMADLKKRNKINATNSESLLQAKNELYKYKCELKSSYIATEKALKSKKLNYKKIISSYDFNWQNAVKEFNASPVVVELRRVEEENNLLKVKIEKEERLQLCTEAQFLELREHLQFTFLKKVLEFSEAMIQYKEALNSQKRNKERALRKPQETSQSTFEFKLFGERSSSARKEGSPGSRNDDSNSFSSIDISIFDDVMIPSENLESQQLEEDVYSVSQSKQNASDTSKEQEEGEDMESLNKLQRHQPSEDQKNKKSLNSGGGSSVQVSGRATAENESQYFRVQASECSKQAKVGENNSEKVKLVSSGLESSHKTEENEEEFSKERQMDFEETFSEGSLDNHREFFDGQYRKTSSFSSDDFPPTTENLNERLYEEEKNNIFKPGNSEKNDFKSFTGFFTMGNDHDSSKPSIFKLF